MRLDPLVEYRNAAAHKTTESIDSLKALKSLSACLSLSIWWEEVRKSVDGTLSQKEVYDKLVETSRAYNEDL